MKKPGHFWMLPLDDHGILCLRWKGDGIGRWLSVKPAARLLALCWLVFVGFNSEATSVGGNGRLDGTIIERDLSLYNSRVVTNVFKLQGITSEGGYHLTIYPTSALPQNEEAPPKKIYEVARESNDLFSLTTTINTLYQSGRFFSSTNYRAFKEPYLVSRFGIESVNAAALAFANINTLASDVTNQPALMEIFFTYPFTNLAVGLVQDASTSQLNLRARVRLPQDSGDAIPLWEMTASAKSVNDEKVVSARYERFFYDEDPSLRKMVRDISIFCTVSPSLNPAATLLPDIPAGTIVHDYTTFNQLEMLAKADNEKMVAGDSMYVVTNRLWQFDAGRALRGLDNVKRYVDGEVKRASSIKSRLAFYCLAIIAFLFPLILLWWKQNKTNDRS